MKSRTKKFFALIWGIIFLLGMYIIYSGVRNFSKESLLSVQSEVRQELSKTICKECVLTAAPVLIESVQNNGGIWNHAHSFIQMFGYLHPLSWYMQEGNLFLAKEEKADDNELSKYEALLMEAADENQVAANGQVLEAEENMEAARQLIAKQMQTREDKIGYQEEVVSEQPVVQPQRSEAVVANAPAETVNNIEEKEITGKLYTADMLDYEFMLNYLYTLDSTTNITKEQLDAKKLLNMDMTIQKDASKPQILIYHTHSQEGFVDSVDGDASTTIVGVGNYLTKLLSENYGFSVLHDTTSYDLVNGKLDRNKAYSMACANISKILKENPSIEVVIDLHRDGIDGDKLVTDVNGKKTAKIMFFNGMSYTNKNGAISHLENPYIEENLSFSLKLQLEAAKYYPGFTRKIYLKGYRYNLHLRPRALLIEAGAQNNTLQEELNAMEPLAEMLARVLTPGS